MRVFGVLLIVVLIALAAVLFLQRESATSSLQAVRAIAADLREEGVAGRPFDRDLAARMASSMQLLVDHPEAIAEHSGELATIAATAASWADEAPAPSVALTVAVALRGAAGDLRGHRPGAPETALVAAQRKLDRARAALAGGPIGTSPVDAVRDRLDNLQSGQQERAREADD